jgi:hypothetical protein
MNVDKFSRTSLRVYASILLWGALMHGLWYFFLPGYPEMQGLTGIQSNFLLLMNLCIGISLLFFSILAYWFSSRSFTINQQKTFAIIMSVFWSCRLMVEVLFPVQIPFVFIPHPTLLIKILGIGLIVILLSPWLVLRMSGKRGNPIQDRAISR